MVRDEEKKWLLEGELDDDIRRLIRAVAREKEIDLLECETAVDHVHVLLRAQGRTELSRAMNYLKGLSAKRLFEEIPELKLDIGMNNFWQRGYGAKEIDEPAGATVAEYIRTQKHRLEKYER
jgi:putative transposase